MKALDSIRKLYRPIQPFVRIDNEQVLYQEIYPSKNIKNYVYCYWELHSKEQLSNSYSYRVVSDGCIDIFFDMGNPQQNFIMGFCRKYTEFQIGKSFRYFGIRFLPSAFPMLFHTGADHLSNNSQKLENVSPDFSYWLSNLDLNETESLADLLNQEIQRIIQNQEIEIDNRFLDSLIMILKRNGYLDIEKDLNTGLSSRQLRRKFNYYIGTSAKAFANVVRFQHILNAKPSQQSLKDNKIYYDVGFFDQAHFIKSFKSFYGVTPSEAFR